MTLTASSLITLGARGLKMALVAVISWILAHALGPENRGTYGLLLLASPFLFKLSNIGVSGANAVLVARDPAQLRAAVSSSVWGGLGLGLLASAGALLSFPLWGPACLRMPRPTLPFLLVLGMIPLGVAASQLEGILQARKRFLRVNAIHVGATVFLLGVLAFLLLHRRGGIAAAVWALLAQAGLIFLLYLLPFRQDLGSRVDPAFFKAQLRFGLSLEAVNLLALLANHASSFLLHPFGIPAAAIGNYFVAKGLAEMSWGLTDSATPVLLPGIAGMPAAEARTTTSRACRVLLFLQALTALALWGAASWLVPRLLPEYTLVMSTVAFLLPGIVVGMIPKVLSCYAVSVGRPLLGLWVTGSGLVAALAGAVLLIPAYGIRGAVGATALGYAAEALVSLAVFCRLSGASPAEALLIRPEDLSGYAKRLDSWLGAR